MKHKLLGLSDFVAEMRHMIVINRLPPTELGDKLKAIGFEELSNGQKTKTGESF